MLLNDDLFWLAAALSALLAAMAVPSAAYTLELTIDPHPNLELTVD